MSNIVENAQGAKFQVTVELTTILCGECGGTYAIMESVRANAQKHRQSWTCPYCEVSWGFEYLKQKDRNEVERAKLLQAQAEESARRAWNEAKHQANVARAHKGHLTRVKNRVSKGVCPCCKRTFENLARHIANKHPDYSETP